MISHAATSQLACVERCLPDSDQQLRAVPLPPREVATQRNIIPPGQAGAVMKEHCERFAVWL